MKSFAWALLAVWLTSSLAIADDEKDDDPTYHDVVSEELDTQSGLFQVHHGDDQLLFEIPHDLLGRDMLLVSRIARVPSGLAGGFIAAGHKTNEQVVRWERHESRVLLRKVSYRNVADADDAIYESVINNNFFPILAAFDIEIEGPAPAPGDSTGESTPKTTVVVDVADFYLSDSAAISGLSSSIRDQYKIKSLDDDRSFLASAHAFPLNVDVRATLTFKATEPPVDADTQTLSMQMHHSMILLPEEPMRPRFADSRVGWFTVRRLNFGLEDRQKAAQERFLRRWRLEPTDPEAYHRGELVEPVKPIVYYLDPSTPEKWRPYVRQGVLDWQAAFETAGFKNAILAKDPPRPEEDPNWHGEDVRYSMVRWAANGVRNAMGPSVADPRSGEIIESDIVWYHNHMKSYRNRLMIETGAANPLARSLPIDDELMGEAIRQVIAHEVGHALGLPHNMIASAAFSVDQLRDPEFVREMGITPSVMEYARQNYVAQPGDGLEGADFIRKIGVYDHYSINWGYRVIPDMTPEEEKSVLDEWILEHADDPRYRFGSRSSGLPVDPRSQTEDLSNDPVAATGLGIANLKRVLPKLIEWTATPGEDYADLSELYGELVWNFTRYCRHVVSVIGGVHQDLKATDQDGPVFQSVPAGRQREAMEFLAEHALATPTWILEPEIMSRVAAGGAVERVRRMQSTILEDLLDPPRLQRLIEGEAAHGRRAYGLLEFLTDLRHAIWGENLVAGRDTHRRTLQRSHVERLQWLMHEATSSSIDLATSDVRALARQELATIQSEASRAAKDASGLAQAHLMDVAANIREFFARPQGETE